MNKKELAAFALTAAFLLSWHMMDIGEILYDMRLKWATNGFWAFDSYALYHLGMAGMVASFLALVYVVIWGER